MKLTILEARNSFKGFLSDIEWLEAIISGQLNLYSLIKGKEIAITIGEESLHPTFGRFFTMFLTAPQECIDSRAIPTIRTKDGVITILEIYVKKEEIVSGYLPKFYPLFNYVRPLEDSFETAEVKLEDGEWKREVYKKHGGYLLKKLLEAYRSGPDRVIDLDESLSEFGHVGAEQKWHKIFEDKEILRFIWRELRKAKFHIPDSAP